MSAEVEICLQDATGAQVALDGGATRVELCSALEIGGLTPSAGTIAAVRALTDRADFLQVLVRPRPGGYVYTPSELAVTCADVAAAVDAGADGVVVGALTPERTIDEEAMSRLVDAARGRTVTFHRAIDVVSDRPAALRTLIGLGVDRVLTSGGADRAPDALAELAEMVAVADGRLQVMAGGGILPPMVAQVLGSGVDAVHLSARVHRRDNGGPGGDGWHWQTDPGLVAAAVDAARHAGAAV